MKKLVSFVTVIMACILSACGTSDSSGEKNSIDATLSKYSKCKVSNSIVYIPVNGGCKTQHSKLNSGNTFALECKYERKDLESNENLYKIKVLGKDMFGIQTVISDIEADSLGKINTTSLKYRCLE